MSGSVPRRCPVCRRAVPPREQNPAFPLCSERCRLIDLGRWLGEEYRVPAEPVDGEEPPVTEGKPEGRS